jgi:hypothetical protein
VSETTVQLSVTLSSIDGLVVQAVPPVLQSHVTVTGLHVVADGEIVIAPPLPPAAVHRQLYGATPPLVVFVKVICPEPDAPGV